MQWYLSYNQKQIGPFDVAQAREHARSNPNGLAWRQGFAEWLPIANVPDLNETSASRPQPPPITRRGSDEIDYKIFGSEMQYVEVELDPGESTVAGAGAMMYKSPEVQLEAIFGDGSRSGQAESGFMGKMLGAGKRLLTGESLFMTLFTHKGSGKGHVAFAAPFPGNIVPITLSNVGGTLICQKDSFLCAARGVAVGIHFQKRILTGLFGGEGFIMQKLEGDGIVFMHAGGTTVERELKPGEELHVDTGCVVGFESTVDFDIAQVGGIKSALFGGEGVFFAHLRGPGRVWLQSLPFSRLAGRMLRATQKRTEEGSVLGGLGNLIDGDNF